jgi:autotransporter strand-loop-strand O-heptosyltransferase
MAHHQQQEFCTKISNEFPKYFTGKKVLDIGSLDINGNNRFFLTDCNYIGLDVGEGSNVDVVQVAHLYDAPDEQFDLIISTEVFEHDMFYQKSIQNIIRMLKPGGAFIFTCASTGRPEHGTRNSDGSWAAPLLANISEEWSDYYMNLTESDIRRIKGFEEAFPDGIFEYNSNPGDLYFFGVKGGIANDLKFSPDHRPSRIQPGEYSDDIFVVDTWPNTPEKEADLVECIRRLREFKGVPILLVSHYAIKPEIQKLVDYYLFDKENPLLLNKDFNSVGVASGRWTATTDYRVDNFMAYHHDYAIWTSMTHAFNFCKYLGKKTIHFMEYDCLLDTFQYRQTFMEPSRHHDAVIYEYYKGSTKDLHLADSPFMATYLFSIKTDIAVEMMKKITSVQDYYANRPEGWQLERLFLKYLKESTSNIQVSQYIANSNELNTQAVWNRDGILRNDAKFQVYPCADVSGNFYVHLISGFHEESADSDYLLEIKYADTTKFITLKVGEMRLVYLGKYNKGQTIKVNYLGVEAYSEFLQDDLAEFLKMNIVTLPDGADSDVEVFYNFVDGAYVELKSTSSVPYKVSFIDDETGINHFSTTLTSGHWAKTAIQYFKNWRIEITGPFNNLIETVKYDATGQRVYIALESKALGDTFAWLPYVEEFRKKHDCTVICSTFNNGLFEKTYPNIEFIEPGSRVNNVYAVYRLGWFNQGDVFDQDRNPRDFKTGPLQRTASDILGLNYQEIKPVIDYPTRKLTKKVGLGIHSTAQAKYWNNPTGWQEVTDWLIENGYEPVILSREEDGYMGNPNPTGAVQLVPGPLDSVIHELSECQAFIGISSGLTWLAWVTNTPTVQISGFTEPFNEPNEGIAKVSTPAGACSGCANRLRFDPGDWNWCPDQKGTPRQFECSKLISADQVIAKLKEILV